MKNTAIIAFLTLLVAPGAFADLTPNCNPKKAARNAAMDATVGVSGRCDTGKAAKDAKEDVVDNAKDAVDVDLDKNKQHERGQRKNEKNKD
ncbi:MAG: hypothetical protein V7700_16260 [Halioglobus sp.]